MVLAEDLVDERAEGGWQHQRAGAVDDHQEEAAGEEEAARADERPDLGPDVFELGLGAALVRSAAAARPAPRVGASAAAHAGGATHVGHSVICHLPLVYAAMTIRRCLNGAR